MKILALADVPCKALWDFYDESRLRDIDLILSAGDLPAEYLSFLVTFAHCPVFYIHGNHDDRYERKPPEGCICAEDQICVYEGIRILGLGGSMRYNYGVHQYTEKEMQRRARKLRWSLLRRGGFDILLTHAPARGHGDQPDLPHQGFDAFNHLMDKYHPRYMIHGHVHMNYGYDMARVTQLESGTKVINAFERYIFEY